MTIESDRMPHEERLKWLVVCDCRGQEACDGYSSAVFEDAVQRLSASPGPAGGYRAHPCRPGYAVRRIHAPLLEPGLLLRRAEGPAAAGQDLRRRPRCVSRRQRC